MLPQWVNREAVADDARGLYVHAIWVPWDELQLIAEGKMVNKLVMDGREMGRVNEGQFPLYASASIKKTFGSQFGQGCTYVLLMARSSLRCKFFGDKCFINSRNSEQIEWKLPTMLHSNHFDSKELQQWKDVAGLEVEELERLQDNVTTKFKIWLQNFLQLLTRGSMGRVTELRDFKIPDIEHLGYSLSSGKLPARLLGGNLVKILENTSLYPPVSYTHLTLPTICSV